MMPPASNQMQVIPGHAKQDALCHLTFHCIQMVSRHQMPPLPPGLVLQRGPIQAANTAALSPPAHLSSIFIKSSCSEREAVPEG